MSSVSTRRDGRVAAVAAGLAMMICGCATTQQTAARLQLNDARLRAEAATVRLAGSAVSGPVSVSSVSVLAPDRHLSAVVVSLRNATATAVSDLPISVGYTLGKRTVYLNGAAGLGYFDNHIPAIAAHGSLTWVDTVHGTLPKGARAFARVGATPTVVVKDITAPVITVKPASGSAAGTGTASLTLDLKNKSSIPQYQLPVYAIVKKDNRVVAASDGSIAELDGGATAVARLDLPASEAGTNGYSVQLQVAPTIFK